MILELLVFTSFVSGTLLLPRDVQSGSGKATFYGDSSEASYMPPPNAENPGACGTEYLPKDARYFVAMNSHQYSQQVCGQCVKITNPANGKSTVSYITDECPTCDRGDLDLSIQAFADVVGGVSKARDLGVLKITWKLVSCPAKYGPLNSTPPAAIPVAASIEKPKEPSYPEQVTTRPTSLQSYPTNTPATQSPSFASSYTPSPTPSSSIKSLQGKTSGSKVVESSLLSLILLILSLY